MTAVAARATPVRRPARDRLRSLPAVLAGPALIVISVLFAMRGFVFEPKLTNQHADILSFILPRYCYLGQRLATGQLPLWNPLLQAGTPYAAEAQSGWLYLPPMALFSFLSCTTAMRAFIVMQPMLAGLGLYWFLRKEFLRRTAATVGGLSAAMAIAGSAVAISMPFAATLAWTPLVLVGASGFFRTHRWTGRFAWAGLAAVAWGQVAGAHMSHGLFMSTLVTACYIVARSLNSVRLGERSRWQAVGLAAGFLLFLPAANLAALLPRLALIGRSSLAGGYAALGETASASLAAGDRPLADGGVWAAWPFALGATPGAYLGAAVLMCIPAAFRTHKRYLLGAFGATAGIVYAMTLDLFVGAGWFRNLVLRIPFGDIYLHNPSRLRHLFLLVGPVIGALGVQGLMEDHPKTKHIPRLLAAGVGAFLVVPLVLGAYPKRLAILAVGIAVIIIPLSALARGHRWAKVGVPVLLAVELVGAALYSNAYEGGAIYLGLEQRGPWLEAELTLPPGPLRLPDVDVGEYTTPGPIARRLQAATEESTGGGRVLTWAPPAAYFVKGYLFKQEPRDWPALLNGRTMLFGIPDPMGYNPFQLQRYWTWVRTTNRLPIFYNAALLQQPSLEDVRVLGVRWLIVPRGVKPPLAADPIGKEGDWVLYQVRGWERRVSVVPSWIVEDSPEAAMQTVTEPGFDPGRIVVLEEDPGIRRVDGARPGTATYRADTPEEVVVEAAADAPSVVVVRNAWDQNWEATVDASPAEVLVADGFLQGIAIPPGKHEIRLTYDEPWIWRGLLAGGAVWAVWLLGLPATIPLDLRRRVANVPQPGACSE